MNKLTGIMAIAALAVGGQAMAADFSYKYFDAGVILAEGPGGSDGKGLQAAGSMDLSLYQNATGFGSVNFIDTDFGNAINLEGGLGFHWPLASVVDFNGGLALGYTRVSNGGGSEVGFSLNAGVRAVPFSPAWELDGGLKYDDRGDFGDDTSIVLGTRYMFKPGMSAGLHLQSGDIDYWLLSVRWEL